MNGTTLKRSPIVLIRMIFMIEALAILFYFLATILGDYKYEFYTHTFFTQIISYQTAKFFFLSGAQFLITLYAFLRWYYEQYTIDARMIVHRSGVFMKKEKGVF